MKKSTFKALLEDHIAPMFSGCEVHDAVDAKNQTQRRATLTDPQHIKVRWNNDTRFQFNLRRSQEFSQQDASFVNNVIVNLNAVSPVEHTPYFEELIGAAIRRAVASLSAPQSTNLVNNLLRDLEQWSEETYEGPPISALVGITTELLGKKVVSLRTILQQPFGKVAASSMEVIATMSSGGRFIGYEHLRQSAEIGETMAPQRFSAIARWTSKGKVAVALSRNGEILVFFQGGLGFARRRGRWRHFNHGALIKRLRQNKAFPTPLCAAVYQSCLDVSFAKVGGGIALIHADKSQEFDGANRVSENDRVSGNSRKAQFLRYAISNRKFQDLPRPLRQTLLAMDGTTVLHRDGSVVAVGAIVKVEAGSKTGGGRKAAAMAMGQYGLGIKVSSDGEIAGFNEVGDDQEPLFTFG
jgi:hypothetical protein